MAETVSKKLADAEEEEKTTLDLSWADLDDSAMAGLVEAESPQLRRAVGRFVAVTTGPAPSGRL